MGTDEVVMSNLLLTSFAVGLWGSLALFVIASATALPLLVFDELRARRRRPALRPIPVIANSDVSYMAAARRRMAAVRLHALND